MCDSSWKRLPNRYDLRCQVGRGSLDGYITVFTEGHVFFIPRVMLPSSWLTSVPVDADDFVVCGMDEEKTGRILKDVALYYSMSLDRITKILSSPPSPIPPFTGMREGIRCDIIKDTSQL